MSDFKENQEYLSQIVGEQLSGVNFVMDYLQLQFNDLSLTVLTPLVVHETNRNLGLGDLSYRDSLCERITHIVTDVALAEDTLNVEFDDDSKFSIALTDEGRAGNEALVFQFREGSDMRVLVIHIV